MVASAPKKQQCRKKKIENIVCFGSSKSKSRTLVNPRILLTIVQPESMHEWLHILFFPELDHALTASAYEFTTYRNIPISMSCPDQTKNIPIE